jgi:hypothetical protein
MENGGEFWISDFGIRIADFGLRTFLCREEFAREKEVRMVFSRKTGIRSEVQIISLRNKRHSKLGSNGEKEGNGSRKYIFYHEGLKGNEGKRKERWMVGDMSCLSSRRSVERLMENGE